MPNTNHSKHAAPQANIASPRIEIHICVSDEDEHLLPKRRRAPHYLPLAAPLPRVGEEILLSSTSTWKVVRIVHEWRAVSDLQIQVWVEYEGPGRKRGVAPFQLTQ